jgi:Carboxypeptidase regulatory-like domain
MVLSRFTYELRHGGAGWNAAVTKRHCAEVCCERTGQQLKPFLHWCVCPDTDVGKDYAAGEPVRGAVVKCTDRRTLQIRSYITGANGEYHFSNLSTNNAYELKAEHNGRQSNVRTLSKFNGRKVATVSLRLK